MAEYTAVVAAGIAAAAVSAAPVRDERVVVPTRRVVAVAVRL